MFGASGFRVEGNLIILWGLRSFNRSLSLMIVVKSSEGLQGYAVYSAIDTALTPTTASTQTLNPKP